MSDRIHSQLVRRVKECFLMLLKGNSHQEDIVILIMDAPNMSALSFTKQIPLGVKSQVNPDTKALGNFNTTLPY